MRKNMASILMAGNDRQRPKRLINFQTDPPPRRSTLRHQGGVNPAPTSRSGTRLYAARGLCLSCRVGSNRGHAMPIVENIPKAKLKAGEIDLGLGLRQARTVDTERHLTVCGLHWRFTNSAPKEQKSVMGE